MFCPIIFHGPPASGKDKEGTDLCLPTEPPTGSEATELIDPFIYHGSPPSGKANERSDPDPPISPPSQPKNKSVTHALNDLVVPDDSQNGCLEVDLSVFQKPISNTPTSSSAQKADENRKAMQDALAPRRPDGTLIDHLEAGQCARAKLPVFRAPETLSPGFLFNPIVEASEFENGKLPSDLSYEDGFVISRKLPNGQPYFEVKYDDPVLNLSEEQRSALELGQKMTQFSSGKQKMPASKEPKVLPHSADPVGVIDNPDDGCMYLGGRQGTVKIANFRVRAVESRLIIGRLESEGPKTEYVIEALRGSISKTITLTAAELDNVVKLIQNELPSCIVFLTIHKPHIHISNYIREQLDLAPQKVYVQRTGFLRLGHKWVFAHDGATPPDPNTVFDTGRYIPDDRRVSDVQAFHNAMAFLDICSKDELIIPLWLLAHLGPMFQLFHEAGRTPRFVTVLVGRSGSLKTSMSLILFRLFHDQGRIPTASFRDTETAMEIKLGMLNGCTGIFDDLRPPSLILRPRPMLKS